jgi:hypothetical protein
MRQIIIAAGERTRVFRRSFSSLPQEIEFTAAPRNPGEPVSGTVERVGSRWVLGRTRGKQPLAPHNRVRKGYWDTFFEVFVTPMQPVILTVERPRLRRVLLIAALVVLVAAIAVVVMALGR